MKIISTAFDAMLFACLVAPALVTALPNSCNAAPSVEMTFRFYRIDGENQDDLNAVLDPIIRAHLSWKKEARRDGKLTDEEFKEDIDHQRKRRDAEIEFLNRASPQMTRRVRARAGHRIEEEFPFMRETFRVLAVTRRTNVIFATDVDDGTLSIPAVYEFTYGESFRVGPVRGTSLRDGDVIMHNLAIGQDERLVVLIDIGLSY